MQYIYGDSSDYPGGYTPPDDTPTITPGIHSVTGLPYDEYGWTDFEELTSTGYDDARVVFVSNAGNDTTGSVYGISDVSFDSDGMFQAAGTPNAYATISAAYSQMRTGYPDIILLKRGDEWTEYLGSSVVSGESASARHIIASYGTATERPLMRHGTGVAFDTGGVSNLIVSGIHTYAHTYATGGGRAVDLLGSDSSNQLFEDCVFERSVSRAQGGTVFFSGIAFRRCQFIEGDADGSAKFYSSNGDDLLMEENVFYSPELQNRHLYLSPSGVDDHSLTSVVLKGNIFYESARSGLSIRSGARIENNLILKNDLIIHGGKGGSEGSIQSGDISDNVIMQSATGSNGDGEWGVHLINNDGTTVTGNIWTDPSGITGSSFAISFGVDSVTQIARNIDIAGNIIYSWAQSGTTNRGLVTSWDGFSDVQNVTIRNNDFQFASAVGCDEIILHYSWGADRFSGFTYSGNRYYSTTSATDWFIPGGSFSGWVSASGETGAEATEVSYTDTTRNIRTYNASLGGSATDAAFIASVLEQSRQNWLVAYTAGVVNDYIRAGFDLDAVEVTY